jgi:hypothetical protein
MALSSTTDLIQGHVDEAARLVLTAVLSHFPELEMELELLGSGYNDNLMKDEIEVFCIWTRRVGNLCHRGSLRRLLTTLPTAPGRSSDDGLNVSRFFVLFFSCKLWDTK